MSTPSGESEEAGSASEPGTNEGRADVLVRDRSAGSYVVAFIEHGGWNEKGWSETDEERRDAF